MRGLCVELLSLQALAVLWSCGSGVSPFSLIQQVTLCMVAQPPFLTRILTVFNEKTGAQRGLVVCCRLRTFGWNGVERGQLGEGLGWGRPRPAPSIPVKGWSVVNEHELQQGPKLGFTLCCRRLNTLLTRSHNFILHWAPQIKSVLGLEARKK